MLLEASPLDVTINIDDSPTTHKGYSPAEKVPHLLNVVGKEYFNNALCIGPWGKVNAYIYLLFTHGVFE